MERLLPLLVALPVVLAGISLLLRSPRTILRFCAAGTLLVAALSAAVLWHVFRHGPLPAAGDWFMLDALSACHLGVMALVFSLSALYGTIYFGEEIERHTLTQGTARRYGSLWFGALAAMILVLISNNMALMWVGMEATTLLTAFLICIHATRDALEAMWKYLLMCSVGVALAFIGILLIAAATEPAGLHGSDALLWTRLREHVLRLDPVLLKAGFLFIVIGYGTKAGLAPMHNWLPDAHSQSPAPVSAVFSGFLLNAALYCILRCLPLVEAATGNVGWGRGILVVFGLLSILVAAIFLVGQSDIKRFLAYSSVEHLGIMALGVGLGGAGAVAALFHMVNHSLSKSLAFLCAGRLGQLYGTHEMARLAGVPRRSPVWGGGLVASLLAIIGVAPFAVFLSEFLILKAAVETGAYWTAFFFLTGLAVVFAGALRHLMDMAWKPLAEPPPAAGTRGLAVLLVAGPLAAVLLLGVWVPPPFLRLLTRAAGILGGTP